MLSFNKACGEAVDASHEMRTLGVCNIVGSFVSSVPTCGAFTRSAVSNASGIQTPLAGLYSGNFKSVQLNLSLNSQTVPFFT